MSFSVIIPARYDSTRLPGKPLLDIAGKPMIQHVYERACDSGAESVYIATDSDKVATAVAAFGGQAVMTSAQCASGTERLDEAIQKIGMEDADIVVNVQGDEPMMSAACIQQVAAALKDNSAASVATLCEGIDNKDDIKDPNIVKVVRDQANYALYFSRAPIPWDRQYFNPDNSQSLPISAYRHYWRHVGLYAYRAGFIHDYVQSTPCELEQIECLEQLRVLYHGGQILVEEASGETGLGVDTEKDLIKIRQIFAEKQENKQ